jgi:predicted SnoaL-like aldol condensation-catalyzing enzyme
MMQDNEIIYRRWIEEVWNKNKIEAVEEFFDQDGIAFYPYLVRGDEPIRGRDKFKQFLKLLRKNYSEINIEISDIAADGNKIISLCEIKVVPRDKNLADKPLKTTGLSRVLFKDGKIVEIWNNAKATDQGKNFELLKLDNN